MKHTFQSLKTHKRAYIIFAYGQKYIDVSKHLIGQLLEYSSYPVFLYYMDGVVNFSSDNMIIQRLQYDMPDSYDVEGHSSSNIKKQYILKLKPVATRHLLENYDLNEIVYLDLDIVITPEIDTIFKKYTNKINNTPLFLKYTWDVITKEGGPLVPDMYLEIMGMERTPTLPALCSCLYILNKNCLAFVKDWESLCWNKKLIEYYHTIGKQRFVDFEDEQSANLLCWLYGETEYLQPDVTFLSNANAIEYALSLYEAKINLDRHTNLTKYYKIPVEYEIPTGLSIIPENKSDIIAFHGLKDELEIIKSINLIKNKF